MWEFIIYAVAGMAAFLLGYCCGLKTSVMAHRLAHGQDPLKDAKPIEGKLEETG